MTRCRYSSAVFFYIHLYFLQYLCELLAKNIEEMIKLIDLLQLIWLEHRWSLYELDYVLTKIDEQDPHYDPRLFSGEETFYIDHVKSSYMLRI